MTTLPFIEYLPLLPLLLVVLVAGFMLYTMED